MKIHYINLDRSTGRRNFMEAQFDRLNLTFSRVPAVDGTKLTSQEMSSVDRSDPRSAILSVGEIGCFLSHRAAWGMIADGPDPYGVVMEDDACLSEHSVFFLNDDSWLPVDTPVVRLETTFLRMPMGKKRWTGKVAGKRFMLRDCKISRTDGYEGGYGGGCYIVHRRYAAWLTRKFSRFSWHVDAEIYRAEHFGCPSASALKGAPLQLVPAIAVQQLCADETFLPPDAEISILEHYPIAEPIGTAQLIVRELKRAFSVTNIRRQIFERRVPFIK